MLVLTRRPAQTVKIGNSITVTILEIRGSQVRIGVDAPRDIAIQRDEILHKNRSGGRDADGGA